MKGCARTYGRKYRDRRRCERLAELLGRDDPEERMWRDGTIPDALVASMVLEFQQDLDKQFMQAVDKLLKGPEACATSINRPAA